MRKIKQSPRSIEPRYRVAEFITLFDCSYFYEVLLDLCIYTAAASRKKAIACVAYVYIYTYRGETFRNMGHDSKRRDMKYRLTIRCLLVVAALVFFSSCKQFGSCKSNLETVAKNELKNRWHRENELFRSGLKIRDDRGRLVELISEDKPPLESARRTISHRVYFYLYTERNPRKPQKLSVDRPSSMRKLRRSYFDRKKRTFFVTHGWLSNSDSESCTMIRDELLKNHSVNVIVIDWSSMSSLGYAWAVTHVPHVSEELTEMIKFLEKNALMDVHQITLVGHSLGAHVMGIAGHYLNGTVGSLIGLDPAYPLYYLAAAGARISDTDAEHVHILHTNAGFLGYETAIGTTDFFVGGGSSQLGCYLDPGGSCSHSRAYIYYAESINTKIGFYGRPCESKKQFILGDCNGPNVARMGGYNLDRRQRGTFYLSTNKAGPFAKGSKG